MKTPPILAATLAAFAFAAPATAQSTADAPLRIVAIDVEGGAATLYITPQGHSLLIDTGWPAGVGGPRARPGEEPAYVLNSAERIVAAAKAEGLSKIDYLVISHYHLDHVGGVADLLKLIPVGTVVDHGPNRENPPPGSSGMALNFAASTLFDTYLKAIEGLPRQSMGPGDILQVDDLSLTTVNASSALIPVNLPGGGQPGANCADATAKAADGGEENARSLGFLMTYGKARIFAGGDTTWNVENALVCPTNRIGPIDFYMANHHGSEFSNSPAFVNSLAARVVLVDNGPTKGGDGSVLATLRAAPRLQALWQLHEAERSPSENAPAARIANLKGGKDGFALTALVAKDGAITLANARTGQRETYPPAP